ncbi:MAG: hypothetical protein R2862_12075 [Thermoanaerobaculia bacterium]
MAPHRCGTELWRSPPSPTGRRRRPSAARLARADVDPLNATDFNTSHLRPLGLARFDDPERNAGHLPQGGLGLLSWEIYLSSDEWSVRPEVVS